MSRFKGTKPSAALIVAVIALVAALGGGAVAGVTISKLNKKERKQVKRIAKQQGKKQSKRQITKREPTLNVNSAKSATTAQSAATAENATSANGVKPVVVDYAESWTRPPQPEQVLFDEGGLQLRGRCEASGYTKLIFASAAPDGLLNVQRTSRPITQGQLPVFGFDSVEDFDPGAERSVGTVWDVSHLRAASVDLKYRGANGKTITGELQLAQGQPYGGSPGTPIADCVISGMLFVS
jgi:hypothetical protein